MRSDWIQIINLLMNSGILIVAFQLVRHVARIELKVETMWNIFIKKFGDE